MELDARNMRVGMAGGRQSIRTLRHTKSPRFLLLLLLAPVFALSAADLAYAWRTKHLLSNAARDAAQITVSTPLSFRTCTDHTPDHPPCSIESAANTVELYPMNFGLTQMSCISPNIASFSGVLAWVFS